MKRRKQLLLRIINCNNNTKLLYICISVSILLLPPTETPPTATRRFASATTVGWSTPASSRPVAIDPPTCYSGAAFLRVRRPTSPSQPPGSLISTTDRGLEQLPRHRTTIRSRRRSSPAASNALIRHSMATSPTPLIARLDYPSPAVVCDLLCRRRLGRRQWCPRRSSSKRWRSTTRRRVAGSCTWLSGCSCWSRGSPKSSSASTTIRTVLSGLGPPWVYCIVKTVFLSNQIVNVSRAKDAEQMTSMRWIVNRLFASVACVYDSVAVRKFERVCLFVVITCLIYLLKLSRVA